MSDILNKTIVDLDKGQELPNDKRLRLAFEACKETSSGSEWQLAFLDMNKLKAINDDPNLGHSVADFVIARIQDIIKDNIRRDKDRFLRIYEGTGDEFLVFLNKCTQEAATEILERIYNLVRTDKELINRVGIHAPVTVSIGVVPFNFERHLSYKEAIKDAEVAMYRAKARSGKTFIYCNHPEEFDIIILNAKRSQKRKNIHKRNKFNLMEKYMTVQQPSYHPELLADAIRMVWRIEGDRVLEVGEAQLAPYIWDHYRNLASANAERQDKKNKGLLSVADEKEPLEPIKKQLEKSIVHNTKQVEEAKELASLEEQISEVQTISKVMTIKEMQERHKELMTLMNSKKKEEADERLRAAKHAQELKKAKEVTEILLKKQEQVIAETTKALEVLKKLES